MADPICGIEREAAARVVADRARWEDGDDVLEPRVGTRPAGSDLGLEEPARVAGHSRRIGTLIDPAVPAPKTHGLNGAASGRGRCYRAAMRGDRVEVVVDTGQGVQTFDIVATKNGRRLEITTARGVVEVSEVTRGGTPVRTGRFMSSRLIALVEHPAQEQPDSRVEVQTRRRLRPPVDAG